MTTPSLFDQPDYARATDPPTSHHGATAPLAGLKARALEYITAAGEHGATTADLQEALTNALYRPERNVIARRLTDLRRLGLICAADTRPGPTGYPETVWVISAHAPTPGGAA